MRTNADRASDLRKELEDALKNKDKERFKLLHQKSFLYLKKAERTEYLYRYLREVQ